MHLTTVNYITVTRFNGWLAVSIGAYPCFEPCQVIHKLASSDNLSVIVALQKTGVSQAVSPTCSFYYSANTVRKKDCPPFTVCLRTNLNAARSLRSEPTRKSVHLLL